MKNKVVRKILSIFFLAVLLTGLAFLVIPHIQVMQKENEIDREIEEWKEQYTDPDEPEISLNPSSTAFPELFAAMQAYNEEIFKNGQSKLIDAWSYQSEVFDLRIFGLPHEIVGLISVPKLEVELPLLLGANSENLARGFAQLSQTSMPIGGNNTNCVVACHRGYDGAAFLREADKLEVGDMIYLRNFWGKLSYEVCEIKVITPSETDEILIQPGRDLLTIVTCTPYRVGSHRLIIFCERATN